MDDITSCSSKPKILDAVVSALKIPSHKANTGPRGTPTPHAPGTPMSQHDTLEEEAVKKFTKASQDYKTHVSEICESQLPSHLAKLVAKAQIKSMVVPIGVPTTWLSELENVETFIDEGSISHQNLANIESVVTGCSYAIAATGTLALTGKSDEGRRVLTLLPDHHFCIVKSSSILNDVSDLFEILSPRDPITLISGPSATSDIELKRVEGVHGPRNLYVIVLET